jgi:hypothetical protein
MIRAYCAGVIRPVWEPYGSRRDVFQVLRRYQMATVQKQSAPFSRRIRNEFSPGPVLRNASVEERVFSLFQPDVLVPSQYLATTRSKTYREPEKKLMLAVLEDALFCFQNGLLSKDNKKKRGLSHDAEEWIMEDSDDSLFSFNDLCELLGIHPQYLRKRLLQWKRAALRGWDVETYRSGRSDTNRKRLAGAGEKRHRYLSAAGF